MPLHIIKMTMIVIFVTPLAPSFPLLHRLLPPRPPSVCRCARPLIHTYTHTYNLLRPSLRLSFSLPLVRRRTQEFLLVPFTLFFPLVLLIVGFTPTSLSACHSPSIRLSLAPWRFSASIRLKVKYCFELNSRLILYQHKTK